MALVKKFNVRLAPISLMHDEIVERIQKVEADYFRIVDGALIFRNSARGNTYPEAVRVFASGVWTEVEPNHE